MKYMTFTQARKMSDAIRASFTELLRDRRVVKRKAANQWRFFSTCLARTLGDVIDEPRFSNIRLAQYKFEIETKLCGHYRWSMMYRRFIFALMHRRDVERLRLDLGDDYPSTGGYFLLIENVRSRPNHAPHTYITESERVVDIVESCIAAEFDAYKALPRINVKTLLRWYRKDSSGIRGLIRTLRTLARYGWTIGNAYNPSEKLLLAIRVCEIRSKRAVVETQEYWRIWWWSCTKGAYRRRCGYATTRHTYLLTKVRRKWYIANKLPAAAVLRDRRRPKLHLIKRYQKRWMQRTRDKI